MPRNSGGTFSLVAGNPVVTGTVISSTVQNNTLNDIATGLTQSISSTGVTTPSANLPMGNYRHTGVGNATAQACYASVTDVQNGSLVTLGAVAGTDTITANAPLTVAAYVAGQSFRFVAAGANTGAVTIDISSLGAKSITKNGSVALSAGDISSGAVCEITYDGTRFQLIGARQGGSVAAVTVNARSSNTIFGSGDLGSMNQFTSTFTQTFTAAGTLGAGWYVDVQNIGTGVITFDANASETFNTFAGALTTVAMYPGEGYRIVCNGTGFDLVGRSAEVTVETRTISSGTTSDFEIGFTDSEFNEIEMEWQGVKISVSDFLQARVKKSGSYQAGGTYDWAFYYLTTGTSAQVGAAAQTSWDLTGQRAYADGACGIFNISKPTTSTAFHRLQFDASSPGSGSALRSMAGFYESTAAAIQGIRLFPASGAFTAGSVVVRGRRGA